MNHLKTIFEEFDDDKSQELQDLQDEINRYNAILIDDDQWKNYYHKIDNYYQKSREDEKLLQDIIDFAVDRIEELKEEKKELIEDIKAYVVNLKEDCDEFIDEFTFNHIHTLEDIKEDINVRLKITLEFTDKLMTNRKALGNYRFYSLEILEFWPHMVSFTQAIKNLGLGMNISYNPQMVSMTILIYSDEKYKA